MNPAGERDGLPDVCRAQFVAMMRAFHVKKLEFKLQLALIRFQPPNKLKLELQRLRSERRVWLRNGRNSK
jgi:hypothetical protein